jgi:hypothetical protein
VSRSLESRQTASIVTKETFRMKLLDRFLFRTRTRARSVALGWSVVAIGALSFSPSALAAGPQLNLAISHAPDPFLSAFQSGSRGGEYTLTVTNQGDAPTSGTITLSDTLPQSLSFLSASGPFGCVGAGTEASPLICTTSEMINPGESLAQQLAVDVPVPVDEPEMVTNTASVSGGGAVAGDSASDPTEIVFLPPWELQSYTASTTDEAGGNYTVAGGHPYLSSNHFSFSTYSDPAGLIGLRAVENIKSPSAVGPLGFIANPAAAPRCPVENIGETLATSDCPDGSLIGMAGVGLHPVDFEEAQYPLFNTLPPPGSPAQFTFHAIVENVSLVPTILPRSESYGLRTGSKNLFRAAPKSVTITLFGVPSQHGSGTTEAPFVSNSSDCSDAKPAWELAVDSWEHEGATLVDGLPDLSDPHWLRGREEVPPVSGCEDPALADQFEPSITTKPLQGKGPVQADQPSGLAVDLSFPQSNDPTDTINTTFDPSVPQAPPLKDVTVKLPAGLSISPSSAGGLDGCSDQASDPAGDQVHYDNIKPVSCPDASKIGSVTATSPLLAAHDPVDDHIVGPQPIPGDVYVLKPHPGDLPVGGGLHDGKFRLLLQLESSQYGINIKLPGTAIADKDTGQLTATFTENPQLPAKSLEVDLKSGPRAPLSSPSACGNFSSTTDFTPWSTPGTPDAHPTASFSVSQGANGSACPSSAAARPFAPTLSAGAEFNGAGKASPFVLHLARQDGEGELSSLEATLPKGLAAKFAGIPYCSEAALATAATRSGKDEQANPSCPASRIGTVTVGAGPGSNPYYAKGSAYLAGPYKGAPLSVAVVTPAVAGPFDLGTVVVRNALYVNPVTAQGRAVSDPFPKIIDGVPLKLRSIDVNLDRPNFTLNPTNCEPLSVQATVHSTDGASASPSNSFQAGACDKLGFKPTLKLSLKGKVSRRSHPSLRAHLTARPGDANIARAQVKLPKSAFLDNAHIGTPCTRVQFAAKACPESSVVGYASATTPLLGYELTGSVYLRSNPAHELPDLVVGFNGPASQPIEIELAGKTDSVKGALRNTFEAVPDVPVTDFNLTLFGGKKGLIIMSSGFCKSPEASIKFTGQNGAESDTTPKVAAKCPKGKKGAKKKGRGNRAGAE